MTFDEWFYSADHRKKYTRDHPAYLAAQEAWIQVNEVTYMDEACFVRGCGMYNPMTDKNPVKVNMGFVPCTCWSDLDKQYCVKKNVCSVIKGQ